MSATDAAEEVIYVQIAAHLSQGRIDWDHIRRWNDVGWKVPEVGRASLSDTRLRALYDLAAVIVAPHDAPSDPA